MTLFLLFIWFSFLYVPIFIYLVVECKTWTAFFLRMLISKIPFIHICASPFDLVLSYPNVSASPNLCCLWSPLISNSLLVQKRPLSYDFSCHCRITLIILSTDLFLSHGKSPLVLGVIATCLPAGPSSDCTRKVVLHTQKYVTYSYIHTSVALPMQNCFLCAVHLLWATATHLFPLKSFKFLSSSLVLISPLLSFKRAYNIPAFTFQIFILNSCVCQLSCSYLSLSSPGSAEPVIFPIPT